MLEENWEHVKLEARDSKTLLNISDRAGYCTLQSRPGGPICPGFASGPEQHKR